MLRRDPHKLVVSLTPTSILAPTVLRSPLRPFSASVDPLLLWSLPPPIRTVTFETPDQLSLPLRLPSSQISRSTPMFK